MIAKWGEIRVREIAGAVCGRLVSGSGNRLVGGLSTDTRQMSPGDAFWALKGERYDGHDFLKEAVSKGAACVVVDRGISRKIVADKEVSTIQVRDTLRALGDFARWWRHQRGACVAAITGSVGKTSTKEMVYQILSLSEEPLKNKGNFNNLVGLPLSIFNMRPGQRRAVLEMGMNRPGEIARLTEIADPDIGVITKIGKAHLEGVGDLAGVVKAKTELIEKISKESQVILNGDDAILMEAAAHFSREFLTFGLGEDNQVRAGDVEPRGTEGVIFNLKLPGAESKIRLSVPGIHNVYNALGAAAIAFCMGEPMENVVAGLEMYRGVPGRFMITRLANGGILIDDTYNSNPASLRAAMESVRRLPAAGGRIIVGLGDMLELGNNAREAHLEAGRMVAEVGASHFIALGNHAHDMIEGAMEKGLPRERTILVNNHDEMVEALSETVRSGDLVLLKASRKIGLDRVASTLRDI